MTTIETIIYWIGCFSIGWFAAFIFDKARDALHSAAARKRTLQSNIADKVRENAKARL